METEKGRGDRRELHAVKAWCRKNAVKASCLFGKHAPFTVRMLPPVNRMRDAHASVQVHHGVALEPNLMHGVHGSRASRDWRDETVSTTELAETRPGCGERLIPILQENAPVDACVVQRTAIQRVQRLIERKQQRDTWRMERRHVEAIRDLSELAVATDSQGDSRPAGHRQGVKGRRAPAAHGCIRSKAALCRPHRSRGRLL